MPYPVEAFLYVLLPVIMCVTRWREYKRNVARDPLRFSIRMRRLPVAVAGERYKGHYDDRNACYIIHGMMPGLDRLKFCSIKNAMLQIIDNYVYLAAGIKLLYHQRTPVVAEADK